MAVLINWSDDFSVDIQELDEQHKQLVNLINSLYTGLASKHTAQAIEQVLDQLINYTTLHFAVEECLMRVFGYTGYDAHKCIHDRLIEQVTEYQRLYKNGDQTVGMNLLYFLKDWLMTHISEEDKQYTQPLTRNGMKRKWLRNFW